MNNSACRQVCINKSVSLDLDWIALNLLFVSVCMHVWRLHVCVCVCERERERDDVM